MILQLLLMQSSAANHAQAPPHSEIAGSTVVHTWAHPTSEDVVVFVHGLGGSAADWSTQIEAFRPHHNVIAVDLPAHGAAPTPPNVTWESMVEDVADAIRPFEGATLVGHSIGGRLALQVAANAETEIHGLVLCSPALSSDFLPGWAAWSLEVLPPGLIAGLSWLSPAQKGERMIRHRNPGVSSYLDRRAEEPKQRVRDRNRTFAAVGGELVKRDDTALLATVEAPTQLMWGTADPVIPASYGRAIEVRHPSVELVEVNGVGHHLPLEAPQRVITAIHQVSGAAEVQ